MTVYVLRYSHRENSAWETEVYCHLREVRSRLLGLALTGDGVWVDVIQREVIGDDTRVAPTVETGDTTDTIR